MDRIVELLRRLRGRDADAEIRAFIENNTFPIVSGDTATFFFYDGEPLESVTLLHWVFGLESSLSFTRLGKTNAWYLTMELPHAGRVEYKLLVRRNGRDGWTRDPLNPHRAFDPFGSNSVCPMPGYVDPTWVVPDAGVRRGRIETFGLPTEVYGGERPIDVYLPAERPSGAAVGLVRVLGHRTPPPHRDLRSGRTLRERVPAPAGTAGRADVPLLRHLRVADLREPQPRAAPAPPRH